MKHLARIHNIGISVMAVFLLSIPTVSAHSLHTSNDFMGGALHPLLGIDHLMAMVAVGLWGAQMSKKATWALPMSFVSLMLIGGLISLPFNISNVENLIAASLLIVGLLIAIQKKLPLWMSSSIVGFFAVFHGHAHIQEMGEHNLAGYMLGFGITTALLHLVGIGLSKGLQKFQQKGLTQSLGVLTSIAGIFFLLS